MSVAPAFASMFPTTHLLWYDSSMSSTTIRLGLVGLGNAGQMHLRALAEQPIPGVTLTAVCDRAERLAEMRASGQAAVELFTDFAELLASGRCDAVIIATPHLHHPEMCSAALQAGCHVFCEKPAGVRIDAVRAMNRVAARSGKLFTIHFNRRLEPTYRQLKCLLEQQALGALQRINWSSTDWFRTERYYASADWRGTWAGEGGGVLLNQCIHILDLWHHFFGMPSRLRAFCAFGKYHQIEVEDEVTAYLEHPNGLTGIFTASTGESPGANRLEIAGDYGKCVVENRRITQTRTRVSVREHSRSTPEAFLDPEQETFEVPVDGQADLSAGVLRNFIEAIHGQAALTIPGEEGVHSLELANAMLLSTWLDDWITFPLDEARFATAFQHRVANSRAKTGVVAASFDLRKSFK